MKGFVKYLQCLLSRFLWANSEQFHPCVYVLLLRPVHNTLHAEIALVEALPDSGSAGEYTGPSSSLFCLNDNDAPLSASTWT